ncbi:MAG: GNAT family N-acetyltransferase [Erysipelotrichaceae bacterium]|nr:GNAT family N-acetyltransferase [Erysipelotrichaceae bacterium]
MRRLWESFKKNEKDKRIKEGEVVDLKEKYRTSVENAFDGVPSVYYDILLHGTDHKVGKCDLRLKLDERMYYYGHVGYNIIPQERGHRYAYHACKVLFAIAREEFGFSELYITCNPDNEASYRTLKRLGGELVEVAEIPHNHELYHGGDKYKCVFRYKIELEDGKDKQL